MVEALRAANGVTAVALLAGVLLIGSASNAQAQDAPAAAPSHSAPKTPSTAKKAAGDKGDKAATAATDPKSKASYAIGVSVGSELARSKISADSVSVTQIAAGMRDALSGKTQMSGEYQSTIMAFLNENRTKQAEPNHAAAATFLAENGKKKDIVTTASGLQYKVLAAGSGDSPKPGDMVTVNYKGTLLNGTEFDSSEKHGGPATFASNQVIPGWQEALGLMKPGAKYQLFIPPKLAYDLSSPPAIPPGSMLIFDVELVSFKPAAAAAAPGAPGSATPHPQIQPAQPADQGKPKK